MDCIYPLKPNDQPLPSHYWAFDCETNGLGGDPVLICAISNTGQREVWSGSTCAEQFLLWLTTQTKKLRGHWFFAHNMRFDIGKVFGQILGDDQWKILMAGSRLITAKYVLKKGTINKRTGKKSGDHIITFADTYNLLVTSLANIGESFGYEKGNTPKKFIDGTCDPKNITDEDINYCLRDCEIVLKFLAFYGNFLEQFQVKLRSTISANAKAIWQRTYLSPDNRKYWINDLEDEKFRKAYYGGRTEVFVSRHEHKTVYHYDINSQYPSQMKYNLFPNPDKLHSFDHPKNFVENIDKVEGCADCTVTTPNDLHIPVLPFRTKSNLIFPLGTFRGVWCLPELRLALSHGYEIVEVHECTVSKPCESPFLEYIKIFETMKKEATTNKDTAIREMSKRFMNALSGKFAQRIPNEPQIYTRNKDELPKNVPFSVQNGMFVTKPAKLERSSGTAVSLISYITSYSRVLLYEGLNETTLYCDTDSAFVYEPFPNHQVHPTDFGKWNLEHVLLETYFVDPKKYAMRSAHGEQHVKIKGVGWRDVKRVIRTPADMDKDVLTFDQAPILQFKTAFRLGAVPMSTIAGTKSITRHALPKRNFSKNGDSTPIILGFNESLPKSL